MAGITLANNHYGEPDPWPALAGAAIGSIPAITGIWIDTIGLSHLLVLVSAVGVPLTGAGAYEF